MFQPFDLISVFVIGGVVGYFLNNNFHKRSKDSQSLPPPNVTNSIYERPKIQVKTNKNKKKPIISSDERAYQAEQRENKGKLFIDTNDYTDL